jgi:Putative polyhydroxyalkanoic acid system protein (PHA_gran_rgn)
MKVTISHNRTKAEVIESVDRSFNEMFQGISGIPVRLTVTQRTWQGSILTFALTASMGFMSTPIKGTVEVTDHDLTVDADLGLLNKLVSEKSVKDVIGNRIKGLLK